MRGIICKSMILNKQKENNSHTFLIYMPEIVFFVSSDGQLGPLRPMTCLDQVVA